jgi:hypothetical protein
VPTFADRGWHVVSVTDSYGRIIGCLDRNNNNNYYYYYYFENVMNAKGTMVGKPEGKCSLERPRKGRDE